MTLLFAWDFTGDDTCDSLRTPDSGWNLPSPVFRSDVLGVRPLFPAPAPWDPRAASVHSISTLGRLNLFSVVTNTDWTHSKRRGLFWLTVPVQGPGAASDDALLVHMAGGREHVHVPSGF